MQLLKDYFKLQSLIHEYFGYTEDWKVIPLTDGIEYFWILNQNEDGSGSVYYHENKEFLASENISNGDYYSASIYTQRFLSKWVYRGEDFTMICIDTHTDGNKFLQVFDNSKEIKN